MNQLDLLHNLIESKDNLKKIDLALIFIWYDNRVTKNEGISVTKINEYFRLSSLPEFNSTKLKELLVKSKKTTKGAKPNTHKLIRSAAHELDGEYGHIFIKSEIKAEEIADIHLTPYLSSDEIENARSMASLYMIIHCYENSARKFIEIVLKNNLGDDWWDRSSSAGMKKKLSDRKEKETKNKFISPRGDISPLFYLDWPDLTTLIRKYPSEFEEKIPDINFIELRFSELERIRNTVAHNGNNPDEDSYNRLILYFKDWCKQVS